MTAADPVVEARSPELIARLSFAEGLRGIFDEGKIIVTEAARQWSGRRGKNGIGGFGHKENDISLAALHAIAEALLDLYGFVAEPSGIKQWDGRGPERWLENRG